MKRSTRDLLKETFASLPNSFAYREVRFYVYNAMQKLETLEKRERTKQKIEQERIKTEELKKQQPWMPPIYQNPSQVQQTLDIIDQMIAVENKSIQAIKNKSQKKPNETKDDDEDDLQTLHG